MITRKRLPSSRLVTVDENASHKDHKGHFVRVRPTAAATDSQLKVLKKALLTAGAKAVRMMPRPPDSRVQLGKGAELVKKVLVGVSGIPPIRTLMETMVKGSSSKVKPELLKLLNDLADREGL